MKTRRGDADRTDVVLFVVEPLDTEDPL